MKNNGDYHFYSFCYNNTFSLSTSSLKSLLFSSLLVYLIIEILQQNIKLVLELFLLTSKSINDKEISASPFINQDNLLIWKTVTYESILWTDRLIQWMHVTMQTSASRHSVNLSKYLLKNNRQVPRNAEIKILKLE